MLFDYDYLEKLRKQLIESLISWNGPDNLYRAMPLAHAEKPSFTCSGIVLQAFNESERRYHAQKLADNMLKCKDDYGLFPNENTDTPHVMSNFFPAFSILDCYPTKVKLLEEIGNWFMETQKNEGGWSLYPNESYSYRPLWTAYALNVLLQLYEFVTEDKSYDSVYVDKLISSIEKGIYSSLIKSSISTNNNIYLWPSKPEHKDICLCTTAMCLHILSKASRIIGKEDLNKKVEITFNEIIKNFSNVDDGTFPLDDKKVKIWTSIHEHYPVYTWNFFAPITLVTILKYIESYADMDSWLNYKNYISYFIDWIKNNQAEVSNGTIGIQGSHDNPDVTVWSTAYSIIVLSRLLKKKNQLERKELELNKTHDYRSLMGNKVYIIHDHDNVMSSQVQLLLNKVTLDTVVLIDRSDKGRSFLDKIEQESNDVCFAIALLSRGELQNRANQNVVLEIGYFLGKLGKDKVRILRRGDVEIPSDLQGILYEDFDDKGAWKINLLKEMLSVGINVPLDKMMEAL